MYVYVYLLQYSLLHCFPCYMMSEVDHLAVFPTTSLKICQYCYKHIYMLHSCSCAFVSGLSISLEYVKTFRMHHFEGNLKD